MKLAILSPGGSSLHPTQSQYIHSLPQTKQGAGSYQTASTVHLPSRVQLDGLENSSGIIEEEMKSGTSYGHAASAPHDPFFSLLLNVIWREL